MTTTAPASVVVAAELAAKALADWQGAPEDRDHEDRHIKADAYAASRQALDQAVTTWVRDLAKTP